MAQLIQQLEGDNLGDFLVTAHPRDFVLGVVRGVAGGLSRLSQGLHGIVTRHSDDRELFEAAVRVFIAQTGGEYLDRPM